MAFAMKYFTMRFSTLKLVNNRSAFLASYFAAVYHLFADKEVAGCYLLSAILRR